MHGSLSSFILLPLCILTNTLTEQAVQVFGLFRDFGDRLDGEPKEQERGTSRAGKRFSRLIPSLLLRI